MINVSIYSEASTTTYFINFEEFNLINEVIETIKNNFTKKDMIEHEREILEQIQGELLLDNVNWIVEADNG